MMLSCCLALVETTSKQLKENLLNKYRFCTDPRLNKVYIYDKKSDSNVNVVRVSKYPYRHV